ncbi:MAG: rhodanese-like domain-containing protein [Phormidesmis sp. CAN_BIN36]|nr:rhodanese-like domain-containing protein [Phormidesmis sp. CAN_BIN36]
MGLDDLIKDAKEALPNITPTPPDLKTASSVYDLKSRLEWGEPALTILDVRPREVFNDSHIMGAMDFPVSELVTLAKNSLEFERDIYIYGANEQETAQAAAMLREAGFRAVAELKGGLAEWKAIGGSTEGAVDGSQEPGEHAYNVVSQVKHHQETQKIDFK